MWFHRDQTDSTGSIVARRLAVGLAGVAAAVALVAYGWVGQFTRYIADDWCSAADLRTLGWAGAQANSYQTWTGKYAEYSLAVTVQLLGPGVTRVLPALLIACGVGATFLAVREVMATLRVGGVAWAWALSVVMTYAVVAAAPDVFQSVFWLTGATTYAAPMVFLGLVVAFVARATRRPASRGWLAATGVLAFIAAGFSETSTAVEFTGVVFLAGITFLPSGWTALRSARPGLLAALLGYAVGIAVLIAAPGNAIRQSFFPPHPSVVFIGTQAISLALHFVGHFVKADPLLAAFVVGIPGLRGLQVHGAPGSPGDLPRLRTVLLGGVLFGGLLLMCFVPSLWAESVGPPDRTLISADLIVVGGLGAAGWLLGSAFSRRWSRQPLGLWVALALGVALAVVPLTSAVSIASHLDLTAQQAAGLDNLAAEIVAVAPGEATVTARWSPAPGTGPVNMEGAGLPTADASNWINQCIAHYYGIESLAVVSP